MVHEGLVMRSDVETLAVGRAHQDGGHACVFGWPEYIGRKLHAIAHGYRHLQCLICEFLRSPGLCPRSRQDYAQSSFNKSQYRSPIRSSR